MPQIASTYTLAHIHKSILSGLVNNTVNALDTRDLAGSGLTPGQIAGVYVCMYVCVYVGMCVFRMEVGWSRMHAHLVYIYIYIYAHLIYNI